jgi:hypothetical protein
MLARATVTDDKIIPFRKRPPSQAELETYRHITRGWTAEMKKMMFPQYYEHEQRQGPNPLRPIARE